MALSLKELLEKEFPENPHFIDEGLLNEGSVMVIGGPPKSYKSFILNSLLINVATGTNAFGAFRKHAGKDHPCFLVPQPRRILLFEQEIGEIDLKARFKDTLAELSSEQSPLLLTNLYTHSTDHSLQLDKPEGVKALDKIIGEIKPDLVAFDPLIEFHTSDENDAQEMSLVLRNLDLLREKHKFTSILSHHTKKPMEGSTGPGTPNRLRGSSALYGKGDAFLMLHVVNREAGIIKVSPTLRRGKPIRDFLLRLNKQDLRFYFDGWSNSSITKNAEKESEEE